MYDKVAETNGCSCSAVSQRWRGVSRPRADSVADSLALLPPQERELIEYITKLHFEGLAPTREMVRNFKMEMAGRELSKRWVDRFINRHYDELFTRWRPSIDRVCHQANSLDKYNSYFDLLYEKIAEYEIEQHLLWYMNEKGFMIGVKAKSTRVFSKVLFKRGGANAPIQDGNREWCTITPTICRDGKKLPTCLIFQGMNRAIWSNWVMDIPAEAEDVYVSSSPNSWTNIQLSMTWITLFDEWTKEKA
jgi:hypothetical protein